MSNPGEEKIAQGNETVGSNFSRVDESSAPSSEFSQINTLINIQGVGYLLKLYREYI